MYCKKSRKDAFYVGDLVRLDNVNPEIVKLYGYGIIISIANKQPFMQSIGILWQNGFLAYEAEVDIELVCEVSD